MAKIVITLDTESKEMDLTLDGKSLDACCISIYKYGEGFDFRAELKSEEVSDDVVKHSSIVAYAKEFQTKSFASVKFLDEKNSIALVEEKKTQEKFSEWIRANLK